MVDEIIVIYHFFKMAAVRHLGFVERILGGPAKSIWRSLYCAKFGSNYCSCFDSTEV